MRAPLRTRLLAATVVAALLALLIVDVVTFTVVTRAQLGQVDDDLERSHEPVERAARAPLDRIDATIREVAPSTYVEVRDALGRRVALVPLHRTGRPDRRLGPLDVEPSRTSTADDHATFASVHDATGVERLRIRVSRQDDGGVLVLGQSLHEVDEARRRLLWVLGGGTLGALLVVGAVGAWLVRIGLAPLTAIERAAAQVSEDELDRRIPGADGRTEVGRLAATINRMLERLDVGFRQREDDVAALQASEARMRRFVADASHELRTPIAATAAYAELFERGAKDRPADLARAMSGIRTEAARMSELVEDLLLLAQLDEQRPLDLVDVDLAELAAEAVQAARALAPDRRVTLHIEDVAIARGDPGRLRQVIDNLLANVRAHTPAGTACTVTVTGDPEGTVLCVEDRGPGLAPEDLARASDRFYRADASRARSSGGTGLGLAIVQAIVASHGGTTALETGAKGGLRVTVHLPVDHPRPGSG